MNPVDKLTFFFAENLGKKERRGGKKLVQKGQWGEREERSPV